MKLLILHGLIGTWIQVHGSPIEAGGEFIANIDPNTSLIIYDRTNLSQALVIAMVILLGTILLGLIILTCCWALRKFYFTSSKVIDTLEPKPGFKKSGTYRAGDHIRQKYGITPDGSISKTSTDDSRQSKYGKYLTPPPIAVYSTTSTK
ncbi:hypothetical protein K7432_011555 [Basidiobolus ranarum]|uniref:Uncharacterized protein n=1 Tax=Basidiobolus ranarum TaxID=34480 RepID=A0ABR2VTN7_9FUNG